MKKKSVAATILVIYVSLVFAVIGICFSVFLYQNTKIEIRNIALIKANGIEIFEDNKLQKSVSTLKLSDMNLGLKPATGEVDEETMIPSTITDEGTSEGYYATVYVKSSSNFSVVVKGIKIETRHDKIAASEQRKNIFVAIKDVKNATKSLEKDEFELARFENINGTQKLTFLIWLGSLSGEELEGSKISFNLEFKTV